MTSVPHDMGHMPEKAVQAALRDPAHSIAPEQGTVQAVPQQISGEIERRRLFSLLDGLPAVVYLKAPDYTIRYANRYFRDRFGEPGVTPCYQLIHGRREPCEPCGCVAVLEEGRGVEWERTFGDGRIYQLYDHPFVDVDGTEMVLHLGIDITARKQAENELERTNEDLRALSRAEHQERLFAEGLAQAVLALNSSLELAEVLDRILDQTQRVIPCRSAILVLLENEQFYLARQRGMPSLPGGLERLKVGVPVGQVPLLETVCKERQPMLVEDLASSLPGYENGDLDWARSLAMMPMVQGEDVIGLIALLSDWADFFSRESLHRLKVFAGHAVLAIQNARLYQQGLEAARQAEFLSAASMALAQSLDLEAVLNNMLDILTYLVPYDRGSVSLMEADGRLVPRATRGYGDSRTENVSPPTVDAMANEPLLALILGGQSVCVADTALRAGWGPGLGSESSRSYLAVPLIVENRTIGVCELKKREVGAFSQQHLWWAEALTAQAAIAIQNAHLFEQMKESREHLQSLSRRLVNVQENERRYVARELHDEAGQALTSLMIRLKLLQRQADDPQDVREGTAELMQMVEGVMENLHRLAIDLRPASLDHVGLVPALHQHCETVRNQYGIKVAFEAVGLDVRLGSEVETALYRIVQEALNNVVRHARASRIDVLLERQGAQVVVVVDDDGVGFDPASGNEASHLGLLGMHERATALGGRLNIESAPGGGTSIYVEVPYVDPDRDR